MILYSEDRRGRRDLECDVVVVGAGPAGIAVASRLAGAGRSVMVLESGAYDPVPDRDAGRGHVDAHVPYFDLAACRPRGLGGATGRWGGWCQSFDDLDVRPRFGTTGWCVSRAELDPYLRHARTFCGIPEETSFRPWGRAHERSVRDSPFVVQDFAVVGRRQLGHRHAGVFENGCADLVLDATVTRIAVAHDGTRVDHLDVGSASGESYRVSGRVFVLAAGGIETARLMLASASTACPDGIGNAHDLVGRNFMEHPHVDVMRLHSDPAFLDIEFFQQRPSSGTTIDGEPMAAAGTLTLSQEVREAEDVGGVQLFLEPAGQHVEHPVARVWKGRALHLTRPAHDDDELALIAVTEQVPNPDSRVLLCDETDRFGVRLPVLRWDLTDVDRRTVDIGVASARGLLRELGATQMRTRMTASSWPVDTLGGAHHLGVTRMARAPIDGVVDASCRVHGVDNLFVAGGGVFPTSGCAPPTLTIIALALRLTEQLM